MELALGHGGFAELLLLVLKGGHYTLNPRSDLDDPALRVRGHGWGRVVYLDFSTPPEPCSGFTLAATWETLSYGLVEP